MRHYSYTFIPAYIPTYIHTYTRRALAPVVVAEVVLVVAVLLGGFPPLMSAVLPMGMLLQLQLVAVVAAGSRGAWRLCQQVAAGS